MSERSCCRPSPFYYPDVPADGLVAYVGEVVRRAAHPKLALYLYHIPQNTGVPWPLEVVAELRWLHPQQVVGLKDSAGDLAYSRAAAVRKAGELRAIIARWPLISSVKAALAATYKDEAWARVALPLRPLQAEQAAALVEALIERGARA